MKGVEKFLCFLFLGIGMGVAGVMGAVFGSMFHDSITREILHKQMSAGFVMGAILGLLIAWYVTRD